MGPTPPSRGVIHPATSATESSTSESSFRPDQEVPAPTTAAPGLTMCGRDEPGPAGGGHDHVTLADQRGQVVDAGVDDGDRRVAARALHGEQEGERAGRWSGPGR